MNKNMTFGQRIAIGYAVLVALSIIISIVAGYAVRGISAGKDRVINGDAQILIEAQRLNAESERRAALQRGFLFTRDEQFAENLQSSRTQFAAIIGRMRLLVDSDDGRRLLDGIDQASDAARLASDRIVSLARTRASNDALVTAFEEQVTPARDRLDAQVASLVSLYERRLQDASRAASATAGRALALVVGMAALSVLLASVIAIVLGRSLARQIGTAVGQVQSSSAELQAAAAQQAAGAKQQASAMNEITTTISELVATSRQIAESAQRVAEIAGTTATSARHGETTVESGQDSIATIRRQVEAVVAHMLDLGRKSQEIGAVLEIVVELAEQTNIVAINATIEAAGAGDAGRRFAVVADEIRKLADRVASSTKDIRVLIDDVRSAVNTTVMATEGNAKAVDAGAKQFTEVASAFRQIAGLVGTTTDAAREIELSTKQQATAAEQVRTAVTDAAQTTHESEASTGQMLQTASQLAGLSRDLALLVQPRAA